MSRIRSAWRWSRYVLPHVIRRQVVFGFCPICEHRSVFCMEGEWLRDQLKCARCRSIPRWCAIVRVLETFFPGWRQMAIHECSPGGSSSAKLARECRGCVQTHWYPDVPAGSVKDGYRSENLEQQTFPDASFDMVITQDVFEHVLDPREGSPRWRGRSSPGAPTSSPSPGSIGSRRSSGRFASLTARSAISQNPTTMEIQSTQKDPWSSRSGVWISLISYIAVRA